MSRFGVRLVSRRTSVRYRFGFPFSSKGLWLYGHCLVTLSPTINEILKWLSLLTILRQESFWWWQCSNRHIISLLLHLHTPFPTPFLPFSPSPISLVVSVDVKHHVYLLCHHFNAGGRYWPLQFMDLWDFFYQCLMLVHCSDVRISS